MAKTKKEIVKENVEEEGEDGEGGKKKFLPFAKFKNLRKK